MPSSAACTRITDRIEERAASHPGAPCLRWATGALTFSETWRETALRSDRLAQVGIAAGNKVAILSPNSPDAVLAILAVLQRGATWLPVNSRDTPAAIGATLSMLGCDALIVHPDLVDAAPDVCRAVPGVRSVLSLDIELISTTSGAPRRSTIDEPESFAAVFPSGGTTGRPKGIAFSQERLREIADIYGDVLARPGDVYLAAAPLTHVGGRICLCVMATGGCVVVLPTFDPREALCAIEQHRVTTITLTCTMLYRLIDEQARDPVDCSSLHTIAYGGSPVSLPRLKQAIELFGPVLEGGYGQTEAPMFISRLRPWEHIQDGALAPDSRLRSVGRPTAACEMRILGHDAKPMGPGEVGEIAVRGEFLMTEYYRAPERTERLRAGGYQRTGDLGFVDEDGYLTIVGRRSDMIITGGFNVYPAEVEAAVTALPGVGQCVAFGLPDEAWGEIVVAAVEPMPGANLDASELRRLARLRLGGVKTPKRIEIVDELPRTFSGKIARSRLPAMFDPIQPARSGDHREPEPGFPTAHMKEFR